MRWTPSGGELFYLEQNAMLAVRVETTRLLVSSPEPLFTVRSPLYESEFDITPSDEFVMVVPSPTGLRLTSTSW